MTPKQKVDLDEMVPNNPITIIEGSDIEDSNPLEQDDITECAHMIGCVPVKPDVQP